MDYRIYIIQVLQQALAFSTMFKNTFYVKQDIYFNYDNTNR